MYTRSKWVHSSLRVFSWWKSQLLTLLFCFNSSWRNSRLDPNPLGGHGNAGGFGWCFCGAVFPSVQKTPKRLHTPSRDTFKQQEVHRRSLESSRLPLERHQPSHRSDPADERAISQCSSFSRRCLTRLLLLWCSFSRQRMCSCSRWFTYCLTNTNGNVWGYLDRQTKAELTICVIW